MNSYLVIGLGYGDEGKGSWVDHLVRQHNIRYVVRFNGGAQALHHVVTRSGQVHGFAQFCSGMLVPGTHTCLSRFMLVDPQFVFDEAKRLEALGVKTPLSRMIVSENAPVITPFNRLMNRMMEVARGGSRHGSCGFGIGVTQGDVETLGSRALHVRDLSRGYLREKLMDLKQLRLQEAERFKEGPTADLYQALLTADIEHYVDMYVDFARSVRIVSDLQFEAIIRENDTVFEGAQGVMLDQVYGTFPFCTRSTTTFENAITLLREARFDGAITRIGLLRAYSTRHGAGPFVTEDTSLTIPPCHNQLNPWQGNFRQGWFDGVAARYALKACGGVDVLAITNLDRLCGLSTVKVCTEYEMPDERFIDEHGELRLFNTFDKELLANRSQALSRTTPTYVEFTGFSAGNSAEMESYLDTLSSIIGHPIHAYSATPDAAKIYRAFSLVSQN